MFFDFEKKRRCDQQARPSPSFVDNTIRPAVAKFSKSRVWDKVPEGSAFIFGDTRVAQVCVEGGSSHAKTARFNQPFR